MRDPGDENDASANLECREVCPFCQLRVRAGERWQTPVPSPQSFGPACFETAVLDNGPLDYEIITTCKDLTCRAKARMLAQRLGTPAFERAMRRRHEYCLRTGNR